MCRPPAEAELMPDPSDTPTEAARLTDKKPDYYASLPAVTALGTGTHYFRVSGSSFSPTVTGRYYQCGVHVG